MLLGSCGGSETSVVRHGQELIAQGQLEEGLASLSQAMKQAPNDLEPRVAYLTAKQQVVGRLLTDAVHERSVGQFEAAEAVYRRILAIEPGNPQAAAGLAAVVKERRSAQLVDEAKSLVAANDLQGADRKVAEALKENPRDGDALALRRFLDEQSGRDNGMTPALRASFQKPATLEFRDAELKLVLQALSQYSGLNFVLDKDVPPNLLVTVFLRNVSVADALRVILSTHQLRQRVLNDTTLLIYPDTPDKETEHQDLVVKNYFLANAEAKQVANMLKTMLKAKNVFADDKLNLLMMRDTPAMIELADRLVATQDVAEPEVMLDVEVMEVLRSRLSDLGLQWPDQLSLTPLPQSGDTLTLYDLEHLSTRTTGATISPLLINLKKQLEATDILANPRLRTHNREKAQIKIGDRVPVFTSTATSTGFVSETVQYLDVGLRLDVEPTVFPNDEISIKLSLEVSSLTNQVKTQTGSLAYQIGTRNASTVLRLKDGETQILGGLINEQDVRTSNRVPGLGDLPVLGRLFSNQSNQKDRRELVLSITPHIVRGIGPPADVPTQFWSGTEKSPRLRSPALPEKAREPGTTAPSGTPAPLSGDQGAPQPAVPPATPPGDGPAAVRP